MLEALAVPPSAYVRSKVAENDNTPDAILDSLMHDCTSVKVALAASPRAQVLVKDSDRRVARCARCTLIDVRNGDSPVANLFKLFTRVA